MKKLTVILGAGFSFPAGFPLGKDIQDKFDRDLRNKFLTFSSGEWMFIEGKNDAEINNGTLYHKHYWYSYIFCEYLEAYKVDRGGFIDYEDFYQFILELSGENDRNIELFENAKIKLFKDRPEFAGEHMFDFIADGSCCLVVLFISIQTTGAKTSKWCSRIARLADRSLGNFFFWKRETQQLFHGDNHKDQRYFKSLIKFNESYRANLKQLL